MAGGEYLKSILIMETLRNGLEFKNFPYRLGGFLYF